MLTLALSAHRNLLHSNRLLLATVEGYEGCATALCGYCVATVWLLCGYCVLPVRAQQLTQESPNRAQEEAQEQYTRV